MKSSIWRKFNIFVSHYLAAFLALLDPTIAARAERLSPPPPTTKKKMNVFGQKIDGIRILLVHKVFFWMIILATLEMNIIDYLFNLTSWSLFFIEKDKRNKIKHISHVGLSLFTDV